MAIETSEISFADLEKADTAHLKLLARMIRVELDRRKKSGK